ncbi:hypothetical protein OHT57_16930 [Streptomyces sp. NBC_00285]|uniref:hypothetical protein n=1 Tax=Streptomyces sp. NBC_00285 TaxID=2975700 RepID=UPI002E28F101|nr:hypothetical protein [Streptomyces sp. NBC_00285]
MDDVRKQVAKLYEKAEAPTEEYNGVLEKQQKMRREVDGAQDRPCRGQTGCHHGLARHHQHRRRPYVRQGAKPVQAFLSWPTEKSLFGVDSSGELSRSGDGGKAWKKLAAMPGGQSQALTAVDADHLLVATMTGV